MEKTVKLSTLKENPRNPRHINEDKLDDLKSSVTELPEMLELVPIILDKDMNILSGNQRVKALQSIGTEEVTVKVFTQAIANKIIKRRNDPDYEPKTLDSDGVPVVWTYDLLCDEIMVKANVLAGEWDEKILDSDFNFGLLTSWGLERIDLEKVNMEEFFQKTEPESPEGKQNTKIILDFTEDDYWSVIEAFDQRSGTKEAIILELLGLS